jgi:D-alanyl-D-alanine carboxypeptidase
MAVVGSPKLIRVEDFPKEQEEMIKTLASLLNSYLEDVHSAFSNNIDFNNLNQQVVTFNVTLNSSGVPKSKIELKSTLKSKIQGILCIRAVGNNYPSANPLISFTYSSSNNSVTVMHIAGLAADIDYNLSVILIG